MNTGTHPISAPDSNTDEQARDTAAPAAFVRRAVKALLYGGIPLCALFLLVSCSTEVRYRTLCFFFDGVPSPYDKSVAQAGTGPNGGTADRHTGTPKPVFYHKPYDDYQCKKCHIISDRTGDVALVKTVREGLCATCHEKIPTDAPYIHAPLLVNACDQCHVPHESPYKGRLIASVPDTCGRCHELAQLSPRDHPQDQIRTAQGDCTRCHDPHEGKVRFFLRTAESSSGPPAGEMSPPEEGPDGPQDRRTTQP